MRLDYAYFIVLFDRTTYTNPVMNENEYDRSTIRRQSGIDTYNYRWLATPVRNTISTVLDTEYSEEMLGYVNEIQIFLVETHF